MQTFYHMKRINSNQHTSSTSVTIVNRKDGYGERLKELEVRGGMNNDLTNPVIGQFKGPGTTGGVHSIPFKVPTLLRFISFQMKTQDYLQINGIGLCYSEGRFNLDSKYFIGHFRVHNFIISR